MTLQQLILADIVRAERELAASPSRLERRRAARLLEAIARCCRTTLASRLRGVAARAADRVSA